VKILKRPHYRAVRERQSRYPDGRIWRILVCRHSEVGRRFDLTVIVAGARLLDRVGCYFTPDEAIVDGFKTLFG
jgi:hypothetical protein